MGMEFQLDRAWINAAKGVRQCQKGDKVLEDGNVDSATKHYSKALDYFASAVDHFEKAEDAAVAKAGKLVDDGNKQLQKAVDSWEGADPVGALNHYQDALVKYDEALDLFN